MCLDLSTEAEELMCAIQDVVGWRTTSGQHTVRWRNWSVSHWLGNLKKNGILRGGCSSHNIVVSIVPKFLMTSLVWDYYIVRFKLCNSTLFRKRTRCVGELPNSSILITVSEEKMLHFCRFCPYFWGRNVPIHLKYNFFTKTYELEVQ